ETVTDVAFSADGSLLAAGDVNHTAATVDYRFGTVAVWDVGSGRLLWKSRSKEGWVTSVAFSANGDFLAAAKEGGNVNHKPAAGSDGLAKLWDTKTGQQVGSTFPGDPGQWGNAEFTPDGSELVVVYDDGTGFVWPTSVKVWEQHACDVAGRDFTPEEWRRFVGGRGQSRVCS